MRKLSLLLATTFVTTSIFSNFAYAEMTPAVRDPLTGSVIESVYDRVHDEVRYNPTPTPSYDGQIMFKTPQVDVAAGKTVNGNEKYVGQDSGYPVANNPTGINGMNRVHSGYTVNTDSCASCHSVHQGYDRPDLANGTASPAYGPDGVSENKDGNFFLMYDEHSICMACHDGTVTNTYDVLHGQIADAVKPVKVLDPATGATLETVNVPVLAKGGLFAVDAGGADAAVLSASQHSLGVKVFAAPGGKGIASVDGVGDANGQWADWSELQCSSCHDPHGKGGNPRLLQGNPNFVMSQGKTGTTDGNFGVNNAQVVDLSVPAVQLTNYDVTTSALALANEFDTVRVINGSKIISTTATDGKSVVGNTYNQFYLKNLSLITGKTVDALDTAYDSTTNKVKGYRPAGGRTRNNIQVVGYESVLDVYADGTTNKGPGKGVVLTEGIDYVYGYDVKDNLVWREVFPYISMVRKPIQYQRKAATGADSLVVKTDSVTGFRVPQLDGSSNTIPLNVIVISYTPVLEVNMAIANKLQSTETIRYGAGMLEFCGSCHYDYSLAKQKLGPYTAKAHHTPNISNSRGGPLLGNFAVPKNGTALNDRGYDVGGSSAGSCLTCHFAHGADATRWGDAADSAVDVTINPTADYFNRARYFTDKTLGFGSFAKYWKAITAVVPATVADAAAANLTPESKMDTVGASSQLKRLPNTGACVICHQINREQYTNLNYN